MSGVPRSGGHGERTPGWQSAENQVERDIVHLAARSGRVRQVPARCAARSRQE